MKKVSKAYKTPKKVKKVLMSSLYGKFGASVDVSGPNRTISLDPECLQAVVDGVVGALSEAAGRMVGELVATLGSGSEGVAPLRRGNHVWVRGVVDVSRGPGDRLKVCLADVASTKIVTVERRLEDEGHSWRR